MHSTLEGVRKSNNNGNLLLSTTHTYLCMFLHFFQISTTENEWEKIANNDFEEKWNFPNCLGAIDGKQISIVRPPNRLIL